jgi:hypothetical protein
MIVSLSDASPVSENDAHEYEGGMNAEDIGVNA